LIFSDSWMSGDRDSLLWLQNLKVNQVKTQENLIENFVQDSLSYILITHGLYSTTLAYPKWLYVSLKTNIYYTHCYDIIILEPSIFFYYIMWVCDDVTITAL